MVKLTGSLILDPIEWRRTLRQRAALAAGADLPLRWNDLLDRLAGGRILPADPFRIFAPGTHFSWHLHRSTIIAALLRRPLAYLCWGVDYHRGLRRMVARVVLRAARVVFVNDHRTAAEVRSLAGVEARQVPYFVDTEFFTFAPAESREDYLFCPGANDRDGEVLLALARLGHNVVWLNNLTTSANRYAGLDKRLKVISRPAFAELREHYQRCAAVVQPLIRDIHAAGQTTTLEALACGAPVVLGAGRSAELFACEGLVRSVAGSDAALWDEAIRATLDEAQREPHALRRRAELVGRRHSQAAVEAALIEGLQPADA